MTQEWTSKDGQKNPATRYSAQSHGGLEQRPCETAIYKTTRQENFLRGFVVFLMAGAALASPASALGPPYPRESITAIKQGLAEPYVGAWSLSMPPQEAGIGDTTYATCDKPVRIMAASENHIFYLGPAETEAEAAIELIAKGGQTDWEPIAGGPRNFAIWIAEDTFHLYENGVMTEADWAQPLIHRRCP